MSRFYLLLLLLLFPAVAAAADVPISIAMVVYDWTLPFATRIYANTTYRPPADYDRAYFQGVLLVMQRTAEQGAAVRRGNTYRYELTIYNCNPYITGTPLPQLFGNVVADRPNWVIMPPPVLPAYDEATKLMAAMCASDCMVNPNTLVKSVFVCGELETSPECVSRPGQRRFDNVVLQFQDADATFASFINHMIQKQQRSISIICFNDDSLALDMAAHTQRLASQAGITVEMQVVVEAGDAFNNTAGLVRDLQTADADAILAIGNSGASARSMITVLQRMQSVNFFPGALCFTGGLDVSVLHELPLVNASVSLIDYVYVLTPFNKNARGFEFDVVSTRSHREAFAVDGNMSSPAVFDRAYTDAFGVSDAGNDYAAYGQVGAAAIVLIGLVVEKADGRLDVASQIKAAHELNEPSIQGIINMDATGRNRQNQQLLQHYDGGASIGLISVTSSYVPVFPAPNWPARLPVTGRGYLVEGDVLSVFWAARLAMFPAIAFMALAFSTWSWLVGMKETNRAYSGCAAASAFPYHQVALTAVVIGVSGCAFRALCLQGAVLHATAADVDASTDAALPMASTLEACLFALLQLVAVSGNLMLNRRARKMGERHDSHRHAATSRTVSVQDHEDSDVDELSHLVKFGAYGDSVVHVLEVDDKDEWVAPAPSALDNLCAIPLEIWTGVMMTAAICGVCSIGQQHTLLSGLTQTHASPDALPASVWFALFLVSTLFHFATLLLAGYVVEYELVCACFTIVGESIVAFVPVYATTYRYREVVAGSPVIVNPTIVAVVGAAVVTVLLIVSGLNMLHRTGASAAHLRTRLKEKITNYRRVETALRASLSERNARRRTDEFCHASRFIFGLDAALATSRIKSEETKREMRTRATEQYCALVHAFVCSPEPWVSFEELSDYVTLVAAAPTPARKKTKERPAQQPPPATTESLLANPVGMQWLEDAIQSGRSPEYIHFMHAVVWFRSIKREDARLSYALFMVDTFLDVDSVYEINIGDRNNRLGVDVSSSLADKRAPPTLFDDIMREVLKLVDENNVFFVLRMQDTFKRIYADIYEL